MYDTRDTKKIKRLMLDGLGDRWSNYKSSHGQDIGIESLTKEQIEQIKIVVQQSEAWNN